MIPTLSKISTDELRRELKIREDIIKNRPKLKEKPNWKEIVQYCEEYMDKIAKDRYELKDFRDYLYEKVLIELYGDRVFDFINEVCDY